MRKVKTDLHNHLRTSSHISKRLADKAIARASRKLGKGGIFGLINFNPSENEIDPRWQMFADNVSYEGFSTSNGIYFPRCDILTVRGQEVPTKEGYHVLLLGTTPNQNVKNGASLDYVLDAAREFKCLAGADHPFHKNGIGAFLQENPKYYGKFDFYETFNGEAEWSMFGKFKYANDKARIALISNFLKNGDENPIADLVSSDGHSILELGRSYTEILMPRDYMRFEKSPEKLNESLKEGLNESTEKNLLRERKSAKFGAIYHAASLALLIAASKIGVNGNRQLAPLLEKARIYI